MTLLSFDRMVAHVQRLPVIRKTNNRLTDRSAQTLPVSDTTAHAVSRTSPKPRSPQAELLGLYEKQLNKGRKKNEAPIRVVYVPLTFDQLIPALLERRSHIAAATITPAREKLVDFASGRTLKVDEKDGLDVNRWFNNMEYAAAKIAGRKTMRYVANIYKYWVAYALIKHIAATKKQSG